MKSLLGNITHEERFSDVEMFGMFNIDMTATTFEGAVPMARKDVREPNQFLWQYHPQTDPAKKDPETVKAKVHPKTHQIISGTPERLALLRGHRERIEQEEKLCKV